MKHKTSAKTKLVGHSRPAGASDQAGSRHKKPRQIYSLEEADQRLYDLFRHHGFGDFPHAQRRQLAEFYTLLMQQQKFDNITRLVSFRDVGIKHFVDSLMVPRLTQLRFPLLDVGTGAGFPGVPLKIVFPQEKILLAEGVRRRVDFLKSVRDKMNLPELQIIGRNITTDFVYPVQGVITRAVEDLGLTLSNVSQCLQVGGRVFFMKGPHVEAEVNSAQARWQGIYSLVEEHAYELPNTPHQRRLIVFEKLRALTTVGTETGLATRTGCGMRSKSDGANS